MRACGIIYLLGVAHAALPWPPGFSRWNWGSSVVVGDFVFLDGGEAYNLSTSGQRYHHIYGSTIAISTSVSWTNETIEGTAIDKPRSFPFARGPWVFSDGQTFNNYGGWWWDTPACDPVQDDAYGDGCTNNVFYGADGNITRVNQTDIEQSLWQLSLPLEGSDGWVRSSNQPPSDIGIATGYLTVSTETTNYALGGSDMLNSPFGVAVAQGGLASQDRTTGQFTNSSSANYGAAGYGAFGESVYLPSVGEEGVLLFIGGYLPAGRSFPWGGTSDNLQGLDRINVYDIATNTFTLQTASGEVPGPRWKFCAAAVEDTSAPGWDVFIHGGFSNSETDSEYNLDYANVFVLSIPSFRWFRIASSEASMRAHHRCHTIGNRQMLVVGGDDPTGVTQGITPDPWPNSVGVFDMATLRWSDRYDAAAAPYSRSDSLVEAIGNNAFPDWNSDVVESLFASYYNGTNSTTPDSEDSSDDGGTNVGAIAGGVVGGMAVLLLVLGLALYLTIKRRRKQRTAQTQRAGVHSSTSQYKFDRLDQSPETSDYQESETQPAMRDNGHVYASYAQPAPGGMHSTARNTHGEFLGDTEYRPLAEFESPSENARTAGHVASGRPPTNSTSPRTGPLHELQG